MKGIIVAVHGKKAVLLDENGRFLQIADRGYKIGQKISAPCLHLRQWASVAAVFVLLCIGSFSFAYYTPTSTMRLTINPDFSLVLNCFDRVIRVEALNEDAVHVLSDQPKIRGNTADCITKIVEAAAEDGYLSEENATVRIAADTKKAPVAEKAREAIHHSVEKGDLPAFVEITTVTEESIAVANTPSATEEQLSSPETLAVEPKADTDSTEGEVLISDTETNKEKSEKESVKSEKKNNKPKSETKPVPPKADTSVISTKTKPADSSVKEKPTVSQENKESAPSSVKTNNQESSTEKPAQEKETPPQKVYESSFTPAESPPTDAVERNDRAEDQNKDKAEKQDFVPEHQEKKPVEAPRSEVPEKEPFEEIFLPGMEKVPTEDLRESMEKAEKIPQNVKDFFYQEDDDDEKDDADFDEDEEDQKDDADEDDEDDDRFDEDKMPVAPKHEVPSSEAPSDESGSKEASPKEPAPFAPADKEPQKPTQAPTQKPKDSTAPTDNKPTAKPQGGSEKPASSSPKPQQPTDGGKHFPPEN